MTKTERLEGGLKPTRRVTGVGGEAAGNMRESKTTDDRLLNVAEAAEMLGLAVGTVFHWAAASKLPCVRLSARCLRFRRSDLEKLIASLVEPPRRKD
jgi:excisionase family DNA binding protein